MTFEIHEKFEPLLGIANKNPLYANIDTVIITGGRNSFKSYTVSGLLSIFLVKYFWKVLFCRYTMAAAEDSVIAEVFEKIDMFGFDKYVKKLQRRIVMTKEDIKEDSDYDNKNVPQIVFKGIKTSSGNQTANLKSLKGFNCFVLDEAEEHPSREDFKKLQRSIRRSDLPNLSILILNPTPKTHWVYEEFFEKKGLKDGANTIIDNVCYIHMVYTDMLRYVPENIIRDFERAKIENPIDFKYNILGAFREKAEGVIFDNWEVGEFDDSLPYVYGLDFGVSDPDACVKLAINQRQKLIFVKEILYENGLSTDSLAAKLESKIDKRKPIIADSASPRTINDLAARKFNISKVRKYANSVVENIKELTNFNIIVSKDSINLIKELNNYKWADKKAEVPEDTYNHLIDALRYAYSYFKTQKYAG